MIIKIYGDSSCNNAQKLILESDVVTGFCSTALLEAAIAGKAIVYPLFDEASNERYSDFLCFSELPITLLHSTHCLAHVSIGYPFIL